MPIFNIFSRSIKIALNLVINTYMLRYSFWLIFILYLHDKFKYMAYGINSVNHNFKFSKEATLIALESGSYIYLLALGPFVIRYIIATQKPDFFGYIIPKLSTRDLKYYLFIFYLLFRALLIPILIFIPSAIVSLLIPALFYILGIWCIISWLKEILRLQLVPIYYASYKHKYTFDELANTSTKTMKKNAFNSFCLIILTIVANKFISEIFAFFTQYCTKIKSILLITLFSSFNYYITIILFSSVLSSIYLHFKDEFEANLLLIDGIEQ